MAQDGHEELLRLLLEYEKQHGEKSAWLLIALGLVYLGQLIRLIETRAASLPIAPAGKDAGSGAGLGDILGLLGPLMSSLKSTAPDPRPARVPPAPEAAPPQPAPPDPPGREPPPPEETREEPRPPRNNEVIKWDPRLVGGGRK